VLTQNLNQSNFYRRRFKRPEYLRVFTRLVRRVGSFNMKSFYMIYDFCFFYSLKLLRRFENIYMISGPFINWLAFLNYRQIKRIAPRRVKCFKNLVLQRWNFLEYLDHGTIFFHVNLSAKRLRKEVILFSKTFGICFIQVIDGRVTALWIRSFLCTFLWKEYFWSHNKMIFEIRWMNEFGTSRRRWEERVKVNRLKWLCFD